MDALIATSTDIVKTQIHSYLSKTTKKEWNRLVNKSAY